MASKKKKKVTKASPKQKVASKKTAKKDGRKRVSKKVVKHPKKSLSDYSGTKSRHRRTRKKKSSTKKSVSKFPSKLKTGVRKKPRSGKHKSKVKEVIIPIEYIDHGVPPDDDKDRHQTYSHFNAGRFDRVEEILARTFLNTISKHTPFEPDEVFIYRHGVSFHILSPKKGWDTNSEEYIANLLRDKVGEGSLQIIDSGKGSKIVKILFGSKEQGTLIGNAVESLEKKITLLNDIRSYLSINYGDPYWDTFFETEESFYE